MVGESGHETWQQWWVLESLPTWCSHGYMYGSQRGTGIAVGHKNVTCTLPAQIRVSYTCTGCLYLCHSLHGCSSCCLACLHLDLHNPHYLLTLQEDLVQHQRDWCDCMLKEKVGMVSERRKVSPEWPMWCNFRHCDLWISTLDLILIYGHAQTISQWCTIAIYCHRINARRKKKKNTHMVNLLSILSPRMGWYTSLDIMLLWQVLHH